MRIHLTCKRTFLLLVVLFAVSGGGVVVRLWFLRHVVSRDEAIAVAAAIARFESTPAGAQMVASLMHDDARIRYHDGTNQWDETKQKYQAKLVTLSHNVEHGIPYSYEHQIAAIKTDSFRGMTYVDLNCRVRYGDLVRLYRKSLTLSKEHGRIGIARRESFVQTDETSSNTGPHGNLIPRQDLAP